MGIWSGVFFFLSSLGSKARQLYTYFLSFKRADPVGRACMRYAGDDAGLFLPVLCAEYCSLGQRTRGRFVERNMFDILLSLKREDSYGLPLVLRDGFCGVLPQPPTSATTKRLHFWAARP